MNTNISKEIADCLKKYLDGAIDREKLKTELQALHSKMIEEKINMQPENHPYVSIIHWVTLEMPHLMYNDNEIGYVYHALLGEEGYDLHDKYWFQRSKRELNDTEQRILDIARKYVDNYNSNTRYAAFHNHKSYLDGSDLNFIHSLCFDEHTRQEFCNPPKISDFLISQMLVLLDAGKYCSRFENFDSDRAVAHKLCHILYSYDNDLPLYCTVSLINGVTTLTVC